MFFISCLSYLELRNSSLLWKISSRNSSNVKTTRSPYILYDITLCRFTLERISIIVRLNGEDLDNESIKCYFHLCPLISTLHLHLLESSASYLSFPILSWNIFCIVIGKVKYHVKRLNFRFVEVHTLIRCCTLLMHQF